MNRVHAHALLMFMFCVSCEARNKTDQANDDSKSNTKDVITSQESNDSKRYDQGVIIENSLPKGGPYTDVTGKQFGYSVFWTRVTNRSSTPLDLTINFPADSFLVPPSPHSYLKLFLPPDTMTVGNESLNDYGATGLRSFFFSGVHKPTSLKQTIKPQEEYLFYVGALSGGPSNQSGGTVRAGLVLKEQDLYYRISIMPNFDSLLFPCGHIVLKKY